MCYLTDNELLQALYTDMQGMKSDMQGMKSDMQTVMQKVTSIEMTLENEISRNISIVAEGHSILNRRLDEALKSESEKEMLLIRVNVLENEIRKIKEQLAVS